jgi:hypothetical protein
MMRRFGGQGGGGTADEHFSKVALLMHFEGADGATVFTDSSSHSRIAYVSGGVHLSTTSPLTGAASGVFSGSSDYVYYTHDAADDIGTGAFCIECDVKLSDSSGYRPILGCGKYMSGYAEYTFFVVDGLYLDFYFGFRGTNQAHIQFLLPSTLDTGVAYKLCVRRDAAGNWAGYVDGIKCLQYRYSPPSGGVSWGAWTGGELNNAVALSYGNNLWVAASPALGVNGRLDELRFTVGDGRYAGDYTPAPGAFPDS